MGRSNWSWGLALLPALLLLLSSPGLADKTSMDPIAVAFIAAPDRSESGLLMKFDMPALPEGYEVYHAEISFRIAGLPAMTELELYEMDGEWSASSVAWSDLAEEKSGGIRGGRIGYWMADHRTGELVKFVLTPSAADMVKDPAKNYGFVVLVLGDTPARLPDLPSATPHLVVHTGPSRD